MTIEKDRYRTQIYRALKTAPPDSWTDDEWRQVVETFKRIAVRRAAGSLSDMMHDGDSPTGPIRLLRASLAAVPIPTWDAADAQRVLGAVEEIRIKRRSNVFTFRRRRP